MNKQYTLGQQWFVEKKNGRKVERNNRTNEAQNEGGMKDQEKCRKVRGN